MVEKTRLFLIGMCSTAGLFALPPVLGASDGLQPWELWGQLPENVTGNSPAATDTHWYAFEDACFSDATCIGTVYAEVSADGTVGPWISTTDRTLPRWIFSAVVTDTHMYLVGGKVGNPGGNTGLVEYAPVNPDGSLGPWATTSPLNNPRESFGLVVSGDHLYVLGGTIHSAGFGVGRITEYARINPDGSLAMWQAGPQLNERHPGCAAAAIDGHVYVFGGGVHGYRTNTVERAAINPDGSLGPWEHDTPLTEFRNEMGIAVFGSTVYLAGGHSGTFGGSHLTSVIYSAVQADHTLGPWTETESLIQATIRKDLSQLGGHVFATGESRDIEHSSLLDLDGDGVPDDEDSCPNSGLAESIMIDDCDTGVANELFDDGCTMADLIMLCAEDAANHGRFVSCVAHLANEWKHEGLITGREKGRIQRCAAHADTP
ncbi:MAG: hypothetical protein V3W34_01355 [Phycisphaerae bacterium]